MINTDKYNITNSRIISMVLPFYARGRKTILLLEAISHPLVSIHTAYKSWALERMIEAHITSQPMSIIWYLNYVFRKYFKNKTDSFRISQDAANQNSVVWYVEEQYLHEGSTPWLLENSSETLSDGNKLVTRNYNEQQGETASADITVYAPQINETSLFDNEKYLLKAREIIDKYLTVQDLVYTITIN